MAGEKIAEALDISEDDRRMLDAFEETKQTMSAQQIKKLAPRQRNPIFSIYPTDTEPEVHVLRVVQRIPPASLNDALLVLPFAKVVSMLKHLDYWAKKVSTFFDRKTWRVANGLCQSENECSPYFESSLLFAENALYANRSNSVNADHHSSTARASSSGFVKSEGKLSRMHGRRQNLR
jgi:hypothetical protein